MERCRQRVRQDARFFLATDVHVPDPAALARCIEWSTVSAALSPFMRRSITAVVRAPGMHVLPPPVALEDYANSSELRQRTLLYCSMPDRGLYYLKDVFPAIRRRVADATLVITSDFTLWGKAPARDAFMRFFDAQPGIRYLGHVDRATLLVEQQRARVMAYPCTFEEGFCIAAAECMAAGAVPVTTNNYALRTTVGDSGDLVERPPAQLVLPPRFRDGGCPSAHGRPYLACAVNRVPASCPHLGFTSGRRSVPRLATARTYPA